MQEYVDYPIVYGSESGENVVSIKLCESMQGYSIKAKNGQIEIFAEDEINLMYAASDFKNKFIPYWKNPTAKASHYLKPFTDEGPEFELCTKPKIKKRGIWTWGHVIYD